MGQFCLGGGGDLGSGLQGVDKGPWVAISVPVRGSTRV